MEKRREGNSKFDALTGLLGKDSFYEVLSRSIETNPGNFALLMLDLDGFKDINDDEGHIKADEKLELIGELLGNLRDSTSARRSGDEFFILLPGITTPDQLQAVTERIQILFIERGIKVSIGGKIHGKKETRKMLEETCDMLMRTAKDSNAKNAFSPEQHREFEVAFETFHTNNASPSQVARLYRDYLKRRRG